MAITVNKDKIAIQAILSTDEYLTEYLGFQPQEIYTVQANDNLLQGANKQQIFIYNTFPEPTVNPLIWGLVYEVDISVPQRMAGTADLAIEQVIALLNNRELAYGVQLEVNDLPVVLSSETSLYQIGCRFISYETICNKPKKQKP